jgi:hypothetical protein
MVISCEQVWLEISNYIDGEVDATLRQSMDEHFHTCKHCTSVLAGTRNVVSLYGDERMIEVPSGYGRRLEKRLAQEARPGISRWSPWSAWLVPVAALIVLAGGVRFASSNTSNPPVKSELAEPGQGIPPNLVVLVAANTRVFHVAGCGVIHNKETVRTLTAKEAIDEGYAPCVRCMRKYLASAAAHPRSLGAVTAEEALAYDEELQADGRLPERQNQ